MLRFVYQLVMKHVDVTLFV